MIDLALAMPAVGMVAGLAATVLGVAQLTCEHAESRWLPRASTVALAIVSGWSAIDCWEALSAGNAAVDRKVVAFTVILALSWGHRRAFGLKTSERPKRAATAADLEN